MTNRTIHTQSNLYETPRLSACTAFSDYLSGSLAAAVCIISTHALTQQATEALTKSFTSKGYSQNDITWICHEEKLSASEVLTLIEVLDPLALVSTDHASSELLAQAYRTRISLDSFNSILVRPAACFSNFERMLTRSDTKQIAWSLLKLLPSR